MSYDHLLYVDHMTLHQMLETNEIASYTPTIKVAKNKG